MAGNRYNTLQEYIITVARSARWEFDPIRVDYTISRDIFDTGKSLKRAIFEVDKRFPTNPSSCVINFRFVFIHIHLVTLFVKRRV
ncbi:MAG TPA: hypothetical protein VFJ51_06655 [Nitrososphaeraceae archaeon]|nr:hypothetical protein [Nitrososphaeraceae archaeon]